MSQPIEGFTRSVIDQLLDVLDVFGRDLSDGVALEDVETYQAVVVLNDALLPG